MSPLPHILLCLLAAGLLGLPAAAEDNDKFIQGTWRFDGQLPTSGKGPRMSWFLEWTFADGTFVQNGYPPLRQTGKYRVAKEQGDALTLELYDQAGTFGTANKQMEVVIDRPKNRLKIQGREGFAPVVPRKP